MDFLRKTACSGRRLLVHNKVTPNWSRGTRRALLCCTWTSPAKPLAPGAAPRPRRSDRTPAVRAANPPDTTENCSTCTTRACRWPRTGRSLKAVMPGARGELPRPPIPLTASAKQSAKPSAGETSDPKQVAEDNQVDRCRRCSTATCRMIWWNCTAQPSTFQPQTRRQAESAGPVGPSTSGAEDGAW